MPNGNTPAAQRGQHSEMLAEETADNLRYFVGVGFEREMSRIQQVDMPMGQVALVRLGSCRQKRRVVSAPNRQK